MNLGKISAKIKAARIFIPGKNLAKIPAQIMATGIFIVAENLARIPTKNENPGGHNLGGIPVEFPQRFQTGSHQGSNFTRASALDIT